MACGRPPQLIRSQSAASRLELLLRRKGCRMPTQGKARRWSYRFLLVIELTIVVLLLAGGCYSRQNYHVLSPQTGEELVNKCNVVVEGHIVSVEQWNRTSWTQRVFFCFSFGEM